MSDDLVVAASFATPFEAETAKNHLEREGIAVRIADDQTVGWFWYLGNALGGVKLLVAAKDAEKAAELLESVPEQDATALQQSGVEEMVCVECGRQINPELGYCAVCDAADDSRSNVADTLLGRQDAVEDGAEIPIGDAMAYRALRAAVFGILACPPLLHLYSLGVLYRLAVYPGEVSPRAIRAGLFALVIDIFALLTVYAFFSWYAPL